MRTVAEMIAELGHVATWSELQPHVTRRAVTAAVRRGEVERLSRDRCATPGLHAARREAERHHGVVSHLSAAVHHGFKVRTPPARPQVTVSRTHHATRADEDCCEIRLRHLGPGDHAQGVTTPLRTVVDCARDLPFEEACASRTPPCARAWSPRTTWSRSHAAREGQVPGR